MIGTKERIQKNPDKRSSFIVVGSNFNSQYYNTQAKKCLVNSNFNSKKRISEFSTKFNSNEIIEFAKKSREMKGKKKRKVSFTKLYY